MQNMPDFTEVMRLAATPEGQKLLAILKNTDSDALGTALQRAQSGKYTEAKNILSALLDSPEAKALLKQLGGK